MSLPVKSPKGYLEIEDRGNGFTIAAQKPHADELKLLFRQNGIPCRRAVEAEHDTLLFDARTQREKAEEILHGYAEAKGS